MAHKKTVVAPRMNLSSPMFTGASFYLKNSASVVAIRALDSVANIWPISKHPIPDARIKKVFNRSKIQRLARTRLQDDTYTPNVMGGVSKLHALGYTGKNVRIAVIDTGVDYL